MKISTGLFLKFNCGFDEMQAMIKSILDYFFKERAKKNLPHRSLMHVMNSQYI